MNYNVKKSQPAPPAGTQTDTAKTNDAREQLDDRLRRLSVSQQKFSRAVSEGNASMAEKALMPRKQ